MHRKKVKKMITAFYFWVNYPFIPSDVLSYIPDSKRAVGFHHDASLGQNVFLLTGVQDVTLFQDLHGKGATVVVFQLHLRGEQGVTFSMHIYIVTDPALSGCRCNFTSSTRLNPPIPSVQMTRKLPSDKLEKNAASASNLEKCQTF